MKGVDEPGLPWAGHVPADGVRQDLTLDAGSQPLESRAHLGGASHAEDGKVLVVPAIADGQVVGGDQPGQLLRLGQLIVGGRREPCQERR